MLVSILILVCYFNITSSLYKIKVQKRISYIYLCVKFNSSYCNFWKRKRFNLVKIAFFDLESVLH